MDDVCRLFPGPDLPSASSHRIYTPIHRQGCLSISFRLKGKLHGRSLISTIQKLTSALLGFLRLGIHRSGVKALGKGLCFGFYFTLVFTFLFCLSDDDLYTCFFVRVEGYDMTRA